MTRNDFVEDMSRMEEIASKTADRCDIWQDRFVYWFAVAIYHIIEWILKSEVRK